MGDKLGISNLLTGFQFVNGFHSKNTIVVDDKSSVSLRPQASCSSKTIVVKRMVVTLQVC